MTALSTKRPVAIDLTTEDIEERSNGHAHAIAPAPTQQFTPTDLAELMSAFNEVTARLQGTHEALQHEVARLREQLREANEQLHRSRRLAALGEMAAGIAHEVRNPLGSIRLYARMLEQDLADRPQERTVAAKIASAVGGLDAVVGDVLAFARELRIRPEPTDGNELLTHALEACWSLHVAESSIRIVRPAQSPAHLSADPVLLHQALVNLVRNALEAMSESPPPPSGHELRLECAAAVEPTNHEITFRIADTGPGISPDVVDRMFNPFFTTRATGTGLGLAIVHRIIDAHGGRIIVTDRARIPGDKPGQGTIFEIQLPTGRSTHSPTQSPANHHATPGRMPTDRGGKEAQT